MKASPTIYAIADASGAIKIGKATCLKTRLQTLQGANASLLRVVASHKHIRAALAEEIAHSLVFEKRIRGEWFAISEAEACEVLSRSVEQAASWNRTVACGASNTPLWMFDPSLPRRIALRAAEMRERGSMPSQSDTKHHIKQLSLPLPAFLACARVSKEDWRAYRRGEVVSDRIHSQIAAGVEVLRAFKIVSASRRIKRKSECAPMERA